MRGLSASWVATFVTVGYSLLSVPVALRYLGVDEFGLFMLVMQVAGYFALIDMGMSGATARILIDYRQKTESGEYGSVILTSACVFGTQSLLLLGLAFVGSPYVVRALSIPTHLEPAAVHLLRWIAAAFAIGAALRVFSSILYAHRRIDLVNLLMGLVPLIGLLLIWTVLAAGGGLWWLPAAFVPPAIIAGTAAAYSCWKLGILPAKSRWGRPRWSLFREMFALGRDIFMINVGAQVIDASQILIVTRTMGLAAAAVWSVSTKLFTLVFQLVTKIESTAVVIFSEMISRGESARLEARFRQVYQLTAGITVAAVAFCTIINGPFVKLWAGPELAWPALCSALLGVVVWTNCVTRCHVDLVVNSKRILGLRYVYFCEACIFVVAALWAGRQAGFLGIIGVSLLCGLLFRGAYTSWRTAVFFRLSLPTVALRWLGNSLVAGAILFPASYFIAAWLSGLPGNPWFLFAVSAAIAGTLSLLVMWFVALPADLKTELRRGLAARKWPQADTAVS